MPYNENISSSSDADGDGDGGDDNSEEQKNSFIHWLCMQTNNCKSN